MTHLSPRRPLVTEGFGIERLPPHDAGRLDPRSWFGAARRPLQIEIGPGKGTFLVKQAGLRPEINFLGVEWAAEFFRFAADRARRRGLDNVRVLRADAVEFLRFWCADAVAAVVHIYFSDPWPKTRHHKRRVIQDASLRELHRVLQPGGEVRLVTDHPGLWAWYEDHAARHARLFERLPFTRAAAGDDGEFVGTNYERKFARQGRPFFAMTLGRRDARPDSAGVTGHA
jgi:tRNA (guanine-N7-)-methyltransferase